MKSQQGFTLIEFMVTLTVAAILLAAATPSLRDLIQNNRATASANELVLAMTIARAEALKRNRPVSVCAATPPDPITGIPTCATEPLWGQGWIVFEDAAATGAPNPTGTGSELIRVWPGVANLQTVALPAGSVPRAFRFTRMGDVAVFPTAASLGFSTHLEGCRGEQQRRLTVARMGRVSVTREACPS